MDDLISRQAALDALLHDWDGMVTSVFDVLKAVPSAQQWIPSREKQPSIGETVLLNDGRYYAVGYLTAAFDWHVNGWYQDFDSWTAWMPLPEPYKGDV